MKAESWSQAFVLAFGFVAGASAVAWLVLTDPEMRMLFRAKSNRIQEGHWRGLAAELARSVVMEIREAFPQMLKGDGS